LVRIAGQHVRPPSSRILAQCLKRSFIGIVALGPELQWRDKHKSSEGAALADLADQLVGRLSEGAQLRVSIKSDDTMDSPSDG